MKKHFIKKVFKKLLLLRKNNHNLDYESCKEFNFESLSFSELESLFEKTAYYWRNTGSDPKNIYWSVLSLEEFKNKELDESEIKRFLDSGFYDIDRIEKICNIVGFNLKECKEFLDFGCGVGRVVVNLPKTIKKVNCVDFSPAHLKEATNNLKNYSKNKDYSTHLISSLNDIKNLPKNQDMIHSFIVLQHNTPPVIEKIVGTLLSILSPGGIAILHIPLASNNYKFDVKKYLQSKTSGKSMEMHILPKSNIFKLAKENSCQIKYSFCDGGCAGHIYSEMVVFQKEKLNS